VDGECTLPLGELVLRQLQRSTQADVLEEPLHADGMQRDVVQRVRIGVLQPRHEPLWQLVEALDHALNAGAGELVDRRIRQRSLCRAVTHDVREHDGLNGVAALDHRLARSQERELERGLGQAARLVPLHALALLMVASEQLHERLARTSH